MQCAFCQKEVPVTDIVGRRDSCPHCGRDLHCCYQCRFYDPKANKQCREPEAELVVDKDRSNFCDYFRFDPQIDVKQGSLEDSKKKLEGLFKKK